MMMSPTYQNLIVIDEEKCSGCEICEAACSFAHEGKFTAVNSRIHRIRIEPVINFAMACQFCADPPCVTACPRDALSKDEKTGVIHVNEKECDGCSYCIHVCPFGAITLHSVRKKAIMCDLCESTEEKEPQCIKYCPKEAISLKPVVAIAQESRKEQVIALFKSLGKDTSQPEPPAKQASTAKT